MYMTDEIQADGGFNIRELGGYPAAKGETARGRFLRSGGVHGVSEAGVATLRAAGLRCVIDLRRADEVAQKPGPLWADAGIRAIEISLFDGLAPSGMAGEDVLLDLYIQALDSRGAAFAAVFEAMAQTDDGAVMFHCTAGKDRTGLIAMLLLLIAGTPRAAIIDDYTRTGPHLAPHLSAIYADAEARGVSAEALRPLLDCAPATMAATLDYIEAQGGVHAWAAAAGIPADTLTRLQAQLSEGV